MGEDSEITNWVGWGGWGSTELPSVNQKTGKIGFRRQKAPKW